MADIDDILFSPVQPWRQLCRDVTDYINQQGQKYKPMQMVYPLNRQRPNGALLLASLLELYHVAGHRLFYYVLGYVQQPPQLHALPFDGKIIFNKYEHGKFPVLGGFAKQHSVRDLNLVPNTYTRHFVFATEAEAQLYLNQL